MADLTAEWFSQVLDTRVSSVDVIDAHSGTTGRAVVRLTGGSAIPDTLFVKLQPFVPEQRKLIRQVGLGVAEARLYTYLGNQLPVRAPRVWHSAYDPDDGSFVMVLEDLAASGCRFPATPDSDILQVAESTVEELAKLHAAFRGQQLPWLRTPDGMRSKPENPETTARRSMFIKLALDQFGAEMPPAFQRLAELYMERTLDVIKLFNQGEHTLIHGDSHIGNLFVDNGRTGFYDWAVVGRGPGMRDVAYFMCNSVPTEVRRANQDAMLSRYRQHPRVTRRDPGRGHRPRAVQAVLGVLVDCRHLHRRNGIHVAADRNSAAGHDPHYRSDRRPRRRRAPRGAAQHLSVRKAFTRSARFVRRR